MNDSSKALALALAGSLYFGGAVGQTAAPKAPGAPRPPAPIEFLADLGVQGERLETAQLALDAHHDRVEDSRAQLHEDLAIILTPDELARFQERRMAPRPPAPPRAPRHDGMSD